MNEEEVFMGLLDLGYTPTIARTAIENEKKRLRVIERAEEEAQIEDVQKKANEEQIGKLTKTLKANALLKEMTI